MKLLERFSRWLNGGSGRLADGRRTLEIEPADRGRYGEVSTDLDPDELQAMLVAANTGDTQSQSKLSAEILEKDWDVIPLVQTRVAAVTGTAWTVAPPAGDESPQAKAAAEYCAEVLGAVDGDPDEDLLSLDDALPAMLTAYLPGYSVLEIVWEKGGSGIRGFQFVPQHFLTFRDSLRPRLVAEDGSLVDLPANKFVVHRYRHRAGDAARGGLIRPLGWLYVLKRSPLIDWMRFMERYGMPFLHAKISPDGWEQEWTKIRYLIRNFGSDGGAVTTNNVELSMLNNPFSASADNVFSGFVRDYVPQATAKVVLGQTSSSDSRDSNRSTAAAHELVRQDLRADDCKAVAATLRRDVLRPLVMWRFGAGAPVPVVEFDLDEAADDQADSQVLANLAQAGYIADAEQVSERFGYRFTLRGPAAGAAAGTVPMSGERVVSPMDAADDPVAGALLDLAGGDAWQAFLGEVPARLAAMGTMGDEQFAAAMQGLRKELAGMLQGMDPGPVAERLGDLIYEARARGAAARAAALARVEGGRK